MKKNNKRIVPVTRKRGPIMILTNVWTSNQNCDAPVDSGAVSVAVATTGIMHKDSFILTITGLTAAAGLTQIATVTNNKVVATSRVWATLNRYSGVYGTDGEPMLVSADTTTPGSIVFRIMNTDAADALNGAVTISVLVGQVIV